MLLLILGVELALLVLLSGSVGVAAVGLVAWRDEAERARAGRRRLREIQDLHGRRGWM